MAYFVYLILGLAVFLLLFMVWIHTSPLRKEAADAMVILGFQCDNDRIHPLLEERLSVALKLIRSHPFKKIILTGGAVTSCRTEADIMKEYLVARGVEEDRIVLDKEAMDTLQNIHNCRKIMEFHRLATCMLISNSFHIRRIQYIARKAGFSSSFYSDRSLRAVSRQIYRTLHELKAFATTYRALKQWKRSVKRS